jgi:excinuclease ABC subunit C
VLRDRIRGLKAYSNRQKVVSLDQADRDTIAFAREDETACGVIFKVREGKVIGRHHYYISGVAGAGNDEILEAIVQRYYIDVDTIPPEILLPHLFAGCATLETWLGEKRVGKVKIVGPETEDETMLVGFATRNAKFLLDDVKLKTAAREGAVPHSVASLQKDLRLQDPPRRIECFDISNIQGADAVASLVVFHDGKPRKGEYRKFRLRSVSGPDDVAGMREVIHRRYSRVVEEKKDLPDLIIVDGGKGQLSAAVATLRMLEHEEIPIIGLAKRLEEVFVPAQSDPLLLPRASSSLRLLQRIRDEAHRFAVTFHREVRTKRTLRTELDLIAGIGKKRARELLEAFGSVQGVKFATEEQLAEIVGQRVAENIREHFETSDAVESTGHEGPATGG